eukprot:scpid91918/ scgid16440/ 
MEHRENSDSLRSDQENVAKDEHNSWSQENIDRAISICLGEERLYEYSINEQKARDAATMEQTVQTTALNPPQTQSRVQTSAGVSRERHTQRLSGDEYTTDGDEYTTPEDYCSKHISRPSSTRTFSDLGHRSGHYVKDISRSASTRTVCDSRQGRGHYVKAIPTLRGIGGVDTSPCNSATPMPSVRTVGSFPILGVPSETSDPQGPAQEAMTLEEGRYSGIDGSDHQAGSTETETDQQLFSYLDYQTARGSRQAKREYDILDELIDRDPVPNVAGEMGSTYLAPSTRQPKDAHWPTPRSDPQMPESVQATS